MSQHQFQHYDIVPQILPMSKLDKSSQCGQLCKTGSCPVIGNFLPDKIYSETTVFKDPNETHRLFVILEMPPENADGFWTQPQGKFLTSILHQQRSPGTSIAVGYMVKCRPATVEIVNGKPRPKADFEGIRYCSTHLWEEIAAFQPDGILLMGSGPTKAFLGGNASLYEQRGKLTYKNYLPNNPERQIPVLATLSTDMVARQPYQGAVVRVDVAKINYWLRHGKEQYDSWQKRAQVYQAPPTEEGVQWFEQTVDSVIANDEIIFATWDTETESLSKSHNRLYSFGFSYHPDLAFAIDVEHPRSIWTDEQRARIKAAIVRLMECKRIEWIAHRANFDLGIASLTLKHRNRRTLWDTQAMAHALEEEFSSKEYSEVSPRFIMAWQGLEPQITHWLDFEDKGWENMKKHRASLAALTTDKVNEYCALDCANTLRVFYILHEALSNKSQTALRSIPRIINPINYVLSHIEEKGIPIDNAEIKRQLDPKEVGSAMQNLLALEQKFKDMPRVKELNKRLIAAMPKKPLFAGKVNMVNLGSSDHMATLFYDIIGYEPAIIYDRAKGEDVEKRPTDVHFLEAIIEEKEDGWEEAEALLNYRQYSKLLGTFLTGFETNASAHPDNRVRATYHPTKTVTHRLSASDPNTQQIPRGGEARNEAKGFVKKVIKAPKGKILAGADYGTAEVRVGAIASQDAVLANTFNNAEALKAGFLQRPITAAFERWKFEGDAHRANAAAAYDVPIRQVTKDQRQAAKNVSFLCVYSADPAPQLAQKINTSVEEAQKVVDGFLGKFAGLRAYLASRDVLAENFGLIHTPLGRTRSLYAAMFPENKKAYKHAINQARNTGIQSSASDMLLLALYEVVCYIEDNDKDWEIINVVHDSVLALIPENEGAEFNAVLKNAMENPKIEEFGFDPSFCAMGCDCELGTTYASMDVLDGTPQHAERMTTWLLGGGEGDAPESRFSEYLSALGKYEKVTSNKEATPEEIEKVTKAFDAIKATIAEEYGAEAVEEQAAV